MPDSYNKNLSSYAKDLRRNMTKEERHLWYDFLRNHSLHFYRQRIVGNYIVDFLCPAAGVVIELDGGQHYEEKLQQYDGERTAFLEKQGLRVLRIPNNEVNLNFRAVCEYIDSELSSQSPDGDSSP